MRILLVEDDAMIGESVKLALRQEGFAVDWVRDGDAGLEAAIAGGANAGAVSGTVGSHAAPHFDLVLLDLGLPLRSGLQVLTALRARNVRTPVLIMTARDAIADRVAGLNAGADDYLVKPFDLLELVARIHALARRAEGRAEPLVRHGGIVLNPQTREVRLDGAEVRLSAREFALLSTMLGRPGKVWSVAQLQEALYGWDDEVGSNTVEVYIHALRKKLGQGLIRNIRGVGYVIPKPEESGVGNSRPDAAVQGKGADAGPPDGTAPDDGTAP